MRKISIVIAYYNRLKQLEFTLETIANTKYPNFEVIIVDDGSSNDQHPSVLKNRFNFIKIIDIPLPKKHINPCIPYNLGFKEADGEIIIIQNPECCHIGDVITYVAENLDDTNYLTFSCANMAKPTCNSVLYERYRNDSKNKDSENCSNVRKYISNIESKTKHKWKKIWYNHIQHRPVYLHFLSAITKKNLDLLGGFDERYSNGCAYDDIEIVARIEYKLKLKMSIVDPKNGFVIHQWHSKNKNDRTKNLQEINKQVFEKHMRELKIPLSLALSKIKRK